MLELNKKLSDVKTDHEKELIQRQISDTDSKIDALVYELYNLTVNEIKLIESSLS